MQPETPTPNPIHRYLLILRENNKRFDVDYVAAERHHEKGIYGGRVVQMTIKSDGQTILHYDHEWMRQPQDAEARMILRKALDRARNT